MFGLGVLFEKCLSFSGKKLFTPVWEVRGCTVVGRLSGDLWLSLLSPIKELICPSSASDLLVVSH